MAKTPLFALPVLVLAACGDDPVQFSEPVGIELKAKNKETSIAIYVRQRRTAALTASILILTQKWFTSCKANCAKLLAKLNPAAR